jgi:hypothetical protein
MKSAGLCWGQRYMWLRVHQLPPEHQHETHVVLPFEVPAGITVAQTRAILTHLTRRHEILRTTYRLDPEPEQHVDPPRPLPVQVVTTERDGTPGPAEVVEELTRRPFDLGGEWPIRACLITTGGVLKRCVLVFNHLAVDVWTLGEIKRELRTQAAGVAARRPAALPPVRHQPADLARHEASADAAITATRAMAYWQEEVARLPRAPFAQRRTTPGHPEARHATLISPALLEAGRRVAGRHGVWPSLVYVAAYTAMTAVYTGRDAVGFLSFVSNRETHPFPDVMTCMFSPVLVRVDCAGDPSFGELLGRVARSFDRAREHSYVPYDKVVEMISREGSRRGGRIRLASEVNFIKQRTKEYGGRRTAFTWNPVPEAWAHCGLDTYLRIDEWRDAVALSLHAMSSVMDADAVERFLRGMEALVLAADDDPRLTDLVTFAPPEPAEQSEEQPVEHPEEQHGRASHEAVQALLAAVRDVHGLAHVDPSDSYTLAGGRALRIPRVLAELGRHGWQGLTLQQLAGPTPLGALAARLAPTPRTSSTQIPSNSE